MSHNKTNLSQNLIEDGIPDEEACRMGLIDGIKLCVI